jgi:hypothetical protein
MLKVLVLILQLGHLQLLILLWLSVTVYYQLLLQHIAFQGLILGVQGLHFGFSCLKVLTYDSILPAGKGKFLLVVLNNLGEGVWELEQRGSLLIGLRNAEVGVLSLST